MTEATVVEMPAATEVQVVELQNAASSLVAQAQAIVVFDAASYDDAMDFTEAVKRGKQRAKEYFDPRCERAHQVHKDWTSLRALIIGPYDTAENTAKSKALTWRAQENRRAEAEQRRIADAARKAEEDARLAMAIQAEVEGKKELAQQIIEAPIEVALPVVQSAVPKRAGTSISEIWDIEVFDWNLVPQAVFVQAVLSNKGAADSVTGAIKKAVQVSGGTRQIPGVRNFKTASMRVKV